MPEAATTLARPRSVARRIALWISNTFLILIVLLIAAHAIWTWHASNALSRAIAEIEARGEPMSVAALQPVLPPRDQNGYAELKEVMAIVEAKTDAGKAFDDLIGAAQLPLSDAERAVLQAYLAERKAALPLIDRAAEKPFCIADIQLTSPLILMDLTELNRARSVAWWLGAEAMIEFTDGDHATAVKRLMQMDVPARAAGSLPLIMGHMVANTCRAVETHGLLSFVPELAIGDEAGALTESEVQRVIAWMLDDMQIEAEQLRAFQGERILQVDAILTLGSHRGSNFNDTSAESLTKVPVAKRYLWGPFLSSNALASAEANTALLPILSRPDFPTARQELEAWERSQWPKTRAPTVLLSALMGTSSPRLAEAKYRILTDRHLAAAALAVRWYRVEHGGAWPGALEALVPKYLPAVPKDPMSAGGTIQYRAGDKPILWSVGTNGTDDGGNDTPARPRDRDWQLPDRVVYLTTQPRPTPVEDQ